MVAVPPKGKFLKIRDIVPILGTHAGRGNVSVALTGTNYQGGLLVAFGFLVENVPPFSNRWKLSVWAPALNG